MHDTIFYYVRTPDDRHTFNLAYESLAASTQATFGTKKQIADFSSGHRKPGKLEEDSPGTPLSDVWEISIIAPIGKERIGYPTQKPEALLERILKLASNPNDVIADFFSGGGTTCAVAQKLGRRWVGCDISRIAVGLTADRIAHILAPKLDDMRRSKRAALARKREMLFDEALESGGAVGPGDTKKRILENSPVSQSGFSVEHWGIYDAHQLAQLSADEFRDFVLACYGARKWTGADQSIHGVKANELIWVAGPRETDMVTARDVRDFAHAVMKNRKPEERLATMIAWNIDPKARAYAEQVMALGRQKPIQLIKIRLWPLAGEEMKAHVTNKYDKYEDFFAFVLPPNIPRIGITRLDKLHYGFDVSEANSMNPGGTIVNVQWDFDFRDGMFSATQGYQLRRKETKSRGENSFIGEMAVEYTFEETEPGTEVVVACRIQDDLGGEGMKVVRLEVE